MAMESTSTITVNSSPTVNQSSSSVSAKTTSDSSFKDEMNKVSSSEKAENTKETGKSDESKKSDLKNETEKNKTEVKTDKVKVEKTKEDDQSIDKTLQGEFSINGLPQLSYNNANQMLMDDIQQMSKIYSNLSNWNCESNGVKFSLSMNEADAKFFIDITKTNDISIENMNVQVQNMINSGADVKEVQQGYQVSQALLTALSESRQNNQPIRIDFDQNIAVILKVNQNGSLSANFIPSDKAVEHYLRQNIEMLKNTFDEKNLPYTELSYSNSSKEQNKRRRNEQKQGE